MLIATISGLNAQKSNYEKRAEKAFNVYDFTAAVELYSRTKTITLEGKKNLAASYYALRQYELAEPLLASIASAENSTAEDLFLYAQTLKYNNKYDEAKEIMGAFALRFPKDKRSISYFDNIADFSYLIEQDKYMEVSNLDFNSSDVDFGTANYAGKMVFASSREDVRVVKRVFNWNYRPYLNLFIANVDANKQFSNLQKFKFSENKKWHEADASFARQGTLMAFTQSNYSEKSSDATVNLEIFFTEFVKGKWSDPISFNLNNKDYSVGHPSLSEDGNTMFFVSDMPGGYGGADIYRIERDASGIWGKPMNLGAAINTESNEMFPFWADNSQVLYFASDGKFGLGGLDIYESQYQNNQFNSSYNPGAPLNSSWDDFALIVDKTRMNGYFSSNRPGGKGDDDIYSYTNSRPSGNNIIKYELLILDSKTGLPVTNAQLKSKNNNLLVADASGLVKIELNAGQLDFLAKAVSYTDKLLSVQLKANRRYPLVVRDTLKLDKIIENKIVPVAVSTFEYVVLDKTTRKPIKNAEIKVGKIALLVADSMGTVVFKLPDGKYTMQTKAFAYKDNVSTLVSNAATRNLEIVKDTILIELAVGQKLVLRNIYYDLDKADILPESANELNKIVELMKQNPQMKVELGSHTDSRGSDEYNLRLSQRRATSAREYLIANGIEAERIKATGFGETQLINRCANGINCSPAEHRQNRRTEILIPDFARGENVKQTQGDYIVK